MKIAAWMICVFLAVAGPAHPSAAEAAGLDLSTLKGKHVVGYQGWFSCPTDKAGLGWRHWFRENQPRPNNLVFDMWPDTSELGANELCPTGLTLRSGKPAYLYSSENATTVARHFRWMRDYGIDGVALERFDSELKNGRTLFFANAVLSNVRAAAEATGRGFFIMYDLSGSDPAVVDRVSRDWDTLTQSQHLADSPFYMHYKGKPVVGLWGIGINDRAINPQQASALIAFFRNAKTAATIIGGVPAYWRTLGRDSRREPKWAAVYRSVDVISPWSVGRFHTAAEADLFVRQQVIPDIAETKHDGIDYMPVIFPGMSWYNGQKGKVALNVVPRDCGKFYQHLAQDVIKAGATMLYSAMFDEVNEGTALYKVVTRKTDTPVGTRMATLDDGNCHVASDWYLHLAGTVTQALKQHK